MAASGSGGGDEIVNPPWFADKDVDVLMYRINRRPAQNLTLFESRQTEPFSEHLRQCLLFGEVVENQGRGGKRRWKLGNEEPGPDEASLLGVIGYDAVTVSERPIYNETTKRWETETVEVETHEAAPFAIVFRSRYLCVARHPKFADGTIPGVFQELLERGEKRRDLGGSTAWDVAPLFDPTDFDEWLNEVDIVDKITFQVKVPNYDAEADFIDLPAALDAHLAGEMDITIKAANPEIGLSKDMQAEPITAGATAMGFRSFVRVRAWGRDRVTAVKYTYDVRRRVRRERVRFPDTLDAAAQVVARTGMKATEEDFSDG